MNNRPIYVITATNPDGSPYHDDLCANLTRIGHQPRACTGCGISAYGDADRDQRLATLRANGYTPHHRLAPEN